MVPSSGVVVLFHSGSDIPPPLRVVQNDSLGRSRRTFAARHIECITQMGDFDQRRRVTNHAQKAADYLHGLQPQTGTTSAKYMQDAA
jgi:hypothetical protein